MTGESNPQVGKYNCCNRLLQSLHGIDHCHAQFIHAELGENLHRGTRTGELRGNVQKRLHPGRSLSQSGISGQNRQVYPGTSLDQMLNMAEAALKRKMTESPQWVFPEDGIQPDQR